MGAGRSGRGGGGGVKRTAKKEGKFTHVESSVERSRSDRVKKRQTTLAHINACVVRLQLEAQGLDQVTYWPNSVCPNSTHCQYIENFKVTKYLPKYSKITDETRDAAGVTSSNQWVPT